MYTYQNINTFVIEWPVCAEYSEMVVLFKHEELWILIHIENTEATGCV